MTQHSANEQYLLELINAERAKSGAQPLAFDNDLSESAEGHSKWMLAADVFSHTGTGGSSATQRMKAAGYTLQGSWATGENIAWATTRNPAGYQDEVQLLHTNLMNSPGHRANLLNANFREVGLGVEVGDYKGRSSAFVTENFGKTGTDLFLTGVAFDDRDGDRFYDPGEGLGGVTVTARNSSGATFKTTTSDAGGYDLALKPGTYTVTFSGADMVAKTQSVSIGTKNVKKDLMDPTFNTGTQDATDGGNDADDGTVTAPAPAPAPAPVEPPVAEAPSGGGNQPANSWLAQFLKRANEWDGGRRDGTLADADDANGSGGDHKAAAVASLDGDQMRFAPSVEAPVNQEKMSELFDGIFADFAPREAAASLAAEIAGDIHLPADAGDAAHAAMTKVFAQLAAGSGNSHSDLLI